MSSEETQAIILNISSHTMRQLSRISVIQETDVIGIIENIIKNFIDNEEINAEDLLNRFYTLPKAIRKAIAVNFCNWFESQACIRELDNYDFGLWDEDIVVITDLASTGNVSNELSNSAKQFFAHFLIKEDVFNPEI